MGLKAKSEQAGTKKVISSGFVLGKRSELYRESSDPGGTSPVVGLICCHRGICWGLCPSWAGPDWPSRDWLNELGRRNLAAKHDTASEDCANSTLIRVLGDFLLRVINEYRRQALTAKGGFRLGLNSDVICGEEGCLGRRHGGCRGYGGHALFR